MTATITPGWPTRRVWPEPTTLVPVTVTVPLDGTVATLRLEIDAAGPAWDDQPEWLRTWPLEAARCGPDPDCTTDADAIALNVPLLCALRAAWDEIERIVRDAVDR